MVFEDVQPMKSRGIHEKRFTRKNDSKKNQKSRSILKKKKEMKDFHGRLEKQDMEFRMRLLAIEEKRAK